MTKQEILDKIEFRKRQLAREQDPVQQRYIKLDITALRDDLRDLERKPCTS